MDSNPIMIMYAMTAWAEILVKSKNKDFEICSTAVIQVSIDPSNTSEGTSNELKTVIEFGPSSVYTGCI